MKKREHTNRSEPEKIRGGMIMSVIMLIGGALFGLAGLWIVAFIIVGLLGLILLISFVFSLFPKLHTREYNKLNPIQKIFSSASYTIEMIGYASSIV